MRVEQIMTRDVLTIGPEAEVRDVARIFVEHGISGLPVCGARREVLGVVSEGDILFKEQGQAERERHLWSRLGRKSAKKTNRSPPLSNAHPRLYHHNTRTAASARKFPLTGTDPTGIQMGCAGRADPATLRTRLAPLDSC